jgi:hypothetical protein
MEPQQYPIVLPFGKSLAANMPKLAPGLFDFSICYPVNPFFI